MTTTLALEQIMLSPQYGEILAAVRAATPVAMLDQLDAATTHATRAAVEAAALTGGAAVTASPPSAVPGWLRLGLLDALTRWADGTGSTCRHSPRPDRPEPVLAAAWRPGLVTCCQCTHLWRVSREAGLTCDGCGRVCEPDSIHPAMAQMAGLIFMYGACGDCRPAITPEPGPLRRPETAEQDYPRGTGRVRPRGSRGRGRGRGVRR
ncbi:hypothetical protein [Micromonospora sp. C41]|uniref:hypothetical protein n=1 Tax=Micromonospora sp. C41 TaxID=2824878 RepID=UPI001B35F00D|nr:hypothetical protein [Micromonospora sp. C41]MBQ1060048.1 hypothetical protein [Micromonospora sp. C41]